MRWVLAVVIIGLTLPTLALPIRLCEYQAPVTSLINMGITLSYHYYDDPEFAGAEINTGQMSLTYSQIYDSKESGFSLAGSGNFNTIGFVLRQADASLSATYRYYVGLELPVFAFGGIEGNWSTTYVQPGIESRAGLGYGRFTDVTPLAKALLIEGDLLGLGAIPASLTDQTLLAIAREIGRRAEYETISDLVAKVEEIIEEAAKVTLDALALLRIEERIVEVGRERFCGGAIQAGVGYEILDPMSKELDFLLIASADWGIAPNPGSQLLIRGGVSAPLPLSNSYTASLTATYDYQLDTVADFAAEYSLWQIKPKDVLTTFGHQVASFALNLVVGGWDVSFQLVFRRPAEALGWTQTFIVSASLDII